jgi:hypothetical protein
LQQDPGSFASLPAPVFPQLQQNAPPAASAGGVFCCKHNKIDLLLFGLTDFRGRIEL